MMDWPSSCMLCDGDGYRTLNSDAMGRRSRNKIQFNLFLHYCATNYKHCKLTLELTRPPPEKYEEEEGFHRISSTAA